MRTTLDPNIKSNLIARLASLDPQLDPELIAYLERCQFEIDEEKLTLFLLTAPDEDNQLAHVVSNLQDRLDDIGQVITDQANIASIMVSAPSLEQPVPYREFFKSAAASEALDEFENDSPEQDFNAADILFNSDDPYGLQDTNPAKDTSQEQEESSAFHFLPPVNPEKPSSFMGNEDYSGPGGTQPDFNPGGGNRPLGISDLIYGAASFAKGVVMTPFEKSTELANAGIKGLKDWRQNRPANYMQHTEELAGTIVQNLQEFRKHEGYAKIEAEVTARGGWDAEVSHKFDELLHESSDGNQSLLIDAHSKVVGQLAELRGLVEKTIQLHQDDPDAAGAKIEPLLKRISEAAGKVPFKIENGQVQETAFQMTEALRERLRALVMKISKFISSLTSGKTAVPGVQ